jgi:hypothetical protein
MNSGIEFALARSYDRFHKKWGLPSKKAFWVSIWAEHLSDCTLDEITTVTDYCESEMSRAPVLPEFFQLIERLRHNKPLSQPIVSLVERMAFLILTSDEFCDASDSQVSDACLVAAAAAHLRSYRGINLSPEGIVSELSGRAKMFGTEANIWQKDATIGKGYWGFYFGRSPGEA